MLLGMLHGTNKTRLRCDDSHWRRGNRQMIIKHYVYDTNLQ